MPDKPILDNDPVVSKSLAPHYVIAMVVLMASLFWALWDEDFGQRPWKAYQHEWKTRYAAFLKSARTESRDAQKEVESSSDYQKLKQDYEGASRGVGPRPGVLLDFPHYTRPAEFRGWKVPEVLIGGNHAEVAKWRRLKALEKTQRNRPDLRPEEFGC